MLFVWVPLSDHDGNWIFVHVRANNSLDVDVSTLTRCLQTWQKKKKKTTNSITKYNFAVEIKKKDYYSISVCHRVRKTCSQTRAQTGDPSLTRRVLYRLSICLPDTLSPLWWLSLNRDMYFPSVWKIITIHLYWKINAKRKV